MANACKLQKQKSREKENQKKKKINWISWEIRKSRGLRHLQYVNYDNGKHDLKVVQVLVAMQHFAQIFRIFNVPRQFHVLLFGTANQICLVINR